MGLEGQLAANLEREREKEVDEGNWFKKEKRAKRGSSSKIMDSPLHDHHFVILFDSIMDQLAAQVSQLSQVCGRQRSPSRFLMKDYTDGKH